MNANYIVNEIVDDFEARWGCHLTEDEIAALRPLAERAAREFEPPNGPVTTSSGVYVHSQFGAPTR